MTAEKKADEICRKMLYNMCWDEKVQVLKQNARKCALIAINEIIQQLNTIDFDKQSEDYNFLIGYWNDVIKEIDNTKQ